MKSATGKTGVFNLKALNNCERGAFGDAFLLYYSGLCFFAQRIVGDGSDAEDIVGEVFLKIWNKHEHFDSETHFKAFLYRATKNACLDFLKTAQHTGERNLHFFEQQDYLEQGYINEIIRAEMTREIHQVIKALPPQASKVITLSFLDGLSNQEIANEMGLSVQTVKNQKGRALGILKSRLSTEHYSLLILTPLLHSLAQLHR